MNELLQLRGISKAYPAVLANDRIDLDVRAGEIHAILGENGAGKSTLMKIIYGAIQPDLGQIRWRGEPVTIRHPAQARQLGIGMVFQHFSLFESLSVAQNIALAVKGSLRELSDRIEATGERFGLPLRADTLVHSLSVGERQRVEIIRCILQQPRLLIMDEPTSVLPPEGVQQLFDTLRQLRDQGCSILYISHKLDEIRQLCDTATVLRAGRVVSRVDPRSHSNDSLAELMIGRRIRPPEHKPAQTSAEPRLVLDALSHVPSDPFGTHLTQVSLQVRPGEIVGIAGVSGNGQNELMRLISGETRLQAGDSGRILIDGRPVQTLDPDQRRAAGLGFVPEERLGRGAVPELPLTHNGLLTAYRHGLTRFGWIRSAAVSRFARACIEHNDVRCGGDRALAGSLSGGNLQKFIVGREMALKPSLFVLSQPTWGLDVGAANSIRRSLLMLRDEGAAVLVVSEELDELFQISDRLHVMFEGRLSPPVQAGDGVAGRIGRWMSGSFLHDGISAAESKA